MSGKFLIDTNIASEQIKPHPEPAVGRWLFSQQESALFLSVVSAGELRKGIAFLERSKRRDQLEEWFETELLVSFSGRILPVTQAISERWGVLSAVRQRSGAYLAIADGLIAATALENDLILVTRNTRDFLNLGLTLHNPWPG